MTLKILAWAGGCRPPFALTAPALRTWQSSHFLTFFNFVLPRSRQSLLGPTSPEKYIPMQGVNSPPKHSAQLRSDRDVQNLVKYNLLNYKHICRDLLQRVIEHNPADSHAFHNLGTLLSADEVIQVQLQGGSRKFTNKGLYLESIRLDNGHASAYNNLGNQLSADEVIQVQLQGGPREFTRKDLYLESIRLDNGYATAYFNLGDELSADEVIQELLLWRA